MTGIPSYPVTESAELARRVESHVKHLANTSMNLPLVDWGAIANDLLEAARALRTCGAAQPPLGPCTQAELDAGFDAKNALLVSMWMDRALKAEAAAQGVWQPIKTIPQDRPIDGWHKAWKCPVTIAYRSWGDRSAWVEKTLTTEWPIEAFTHWRETSAAPSVSSTSRECATCGGLGRIPHESGGYGINCPSCTVTSTNHRTAKD